MVKCFHCGDNCEDIRIEHHNKSFCCQGCRTVFDILQENDLGYYYNLEKTPGVSPNQIDGKYNFLDIAGIVEKLLDFNDETTQIISFSIPSIHCSSCIWVLENLNKLHYGVKSSLVNFPEKTVRITINPEVVSIKDVVLLLCRIGYEPYISLEDCSKKKKDINRSLTYKLGVAGFAFGNIMFLSFPEYFEVNEFWLDQFKGLFRWMMFTFSLPVVFYSGRDYFISAFKGLRSRSLNIDIPIAIGITVLLVRSTIDIVMNWGTGFFDSLSGLIFFLLLGKYFQQKTYAFLSFERDYKSYFPIAVTRLIRFSGSALDDVSEVAEKITEEQTEVFKIVKGDRLLIRNNELIPVDSILIKGNALIDYSFVTGEAAPVTKVIAEKLFAGGKQQAGIIEVEVLKPVEQSYLTQLWSNEVFNKSQTGIFQSLTDGISKRFTIAVITIAFIATLFWLIYDPSKAFNVFTAVLIVACPCAIALASPFTLGNLLRIFGKNKLYLKEAAVIEQMAKVDTVVFDKTGTLTTNKRNVITYEGVALSREEESLLTSTLRASNHPLSRALYSILDKNNIQTLDEFQELTGKGIAAKLNQNSIKVGSYDFVEREHISEEIEKTVVHVSANNQYKGCYIFHNEYREGVAEIFKSLSPAHELIVLSGDNEGEKKHLQKLLPLGTKLMFNQKPEDKLEFIKNLQESGKNVMMVGDGLNDSGALKQSNVGFAISENVNVFSPACDGILDASQFKRIVSYLHLSKSGVRIIKWSFILSLVYNVIGLSFAVSGNLMPVVAAILMPLSSISIVIFTTVATQYASRNL
jgi:Cu+-exporting ATPase